MEFEIKNTIPFKLAPSQNKYLDINLIKYVQDLNKENYKTDERNQGIYTYINGEMFMFNIVKASVLPNLIYRDSVFFSSTI